MFESKYCDFITNFTRIGEKFIHQKINKEQLINCFNIKQLEITFRIPSESKFEHGFIALLMLTEKMLNHKPIFLLDKNTLSKKRAIKVGLVVTIKDEMIDNYLNLCNVHSVPKFYDYGISFSISNANQPFAYKMKKILSNTVFNFDKDVHSYYDYLGELEYEFDFLFRTYFKNILMNKLIVSNKGVYFSDLNSLTETTMINEIEKQIELEELENESEDLDLEDFDDLDNLDEFEESEYLDELEESEDLEDIEGIEDLEELENESEDLNIENVEEDENRFIEEINKEEEISDLFLSELKDMFKVEYIDNLKKENILKDREMEIEYMNNKIKTN